MGGFCVYGISRTMCRRRAERETSQYIPGGGGRTYTVLEWGAMVREKTERLFAEQVKRERISPELDSPRFCEDWIASQPGETRQTVIMYRGEKIDKNGGVVLRKGEPVMTWQEYDPSKQPTRPFGGA